MKIAPHQGQQEAFLSTAADVCVFGGARGGGKTFSLLLEGLRHVSTKGFGAVIFRRTFPRITAEGGMWDQSLDLYSKAGGKPKQHNLTWHFPRGAKVQFAHLQHETSLQEWQGAQICLLAFDELCEFTAKQFWTLFGSNRSTCGVRPYIRATCNPDAESWVADLLKWWIDQETGYPIAERAGKLRWFARKSDELIWGNTPMEVKVRAGRKSRPRSLTFIPAKLEDNPTLEKTNPEYRANLEALPLVERERFLAGNWKIRPQAGLMFPRHAWKFCDVVPAGARFCRAWDKAGTSASEGNKGARTAGVLLAEESGRFYVVDVRAGRWGDLEREREIRNTAELDAARYGHVRVRLEQEPGSGGKDSALWTVRNLAGFDVKYKTASGEKAARWRPFASQVQAGNVLIVKGDWNFADYTQELDQLSGDRKQDANRLKDCADASADAFSELALGVSRTLDRDLLCSGDDPDEDDRDRRLSIAGQSDEPLDTDDLPETLAGILGDISSHGHGGNRFDGLFSDDD